jgi:hypothetical protein
VRCWVAPHLLLKDHDHRFDPICEMRSAFGHRYVEIGAFDCAGCELRALVAAGMEIVNSCEGVVGSSCPRKECKNFSRALPARASNGYLHACAVPHRARYSCFPVCPLITLMILQVKVSPISFIQPSAAPQQSPTPSHSTSRTGHLHYGQLP